MKSKDERGKNFSSSRFRLPFTFIFAATVICPFQSRTSMAFTTLDMTGFTIPRRTMSEQRWKEDRVGIVSR